MSSYAPVSLGTISDVIPSGLVIPPVDYTSRDYASIVNDLIALIPTYLPEWTDRSPGDFGMVLIELFAYMGDILNFYSDRIANEAFIATAQQRQSVLNLAQLLDYTPHNNVAATVQLQFSISSPSNPVLVPQGSQVSTTLTGNQTVIFSTTQDLWIYGDGVTNYKGNTATGQPAIVSNGQPGQSILLSDPTVPYPTYTFNGGNANQTVMVTPPGGGTAVQWLLASNNSFTNPAQPGTATVFTVANGNTIVFGNNTNGMIPPTGSTIMITYQPAAPATYAGQVQAMHGTVNYGEGIGISDGTPNQTYNLFQTPVIDNSQVVYVDEGNGPQPWIYFPRIMDAMSSDNAYTLAIDANGVVTVQFGDSVSGNIPPPGAFITADYAVGGGSIGNVSAGSLTQMVTGPPGVQSVTNPLASSGGADIESTDHIRIHAPLSVTAINRAVSLDDYAALVLNIPSIAKAAAMSTAYNAVNLYIHPAGDFFSSVPALINAVNVIMPGITNSAMSGYLDDKKMVTFSIVVLPPQYNNTTSNVISAGYVPCNVTVTLQVLAQYHQSAVQSDVQAAISNLFLFSVVDFGSRITLSSVYHAIMEVTGVDYVVVNALYRNEVAPAAADIVCAPYEIPQVSNIQITASGGIVY